MKLILISFLLIISNFCFSQKIYEKTARVTLDEFIIKKNDGQLYFEIEVRMIGLVSHIEIKDPFKIEKSGNVFNKISKWWWLKLVKTKDFKYTNLYSRKILDEDYFINDTFDSNAGIVMRCELVKLKSVFFGSTSKRELQIEIYSKIGSKIYSKTFTLDKIKIIEDGEVRLGVEPS